MIEFTEIIGVFGYAVETAGVLVILLGFVLATFKFIKSHGVSTIDASYKEFRRNLGRSILIGLEFLIAGDIIRTVVVSATLGNIAVLGLIILIRTFLGITLHLEIEGRWPWQNSYGKEKKVE